MESLPIAYLGLPLRGLVNSIKLWQPIVEKFEARLARWKARSLSMGGKVTLLKSVLVSLSIFFMSIFQILVEVKERLDRIQRQLL